MLIQDKIQMPEILIISTYLKDVKDRNVGLVHCHNIRTIVM